MGYVRLLLAALVLPVALCAGCASSPRAAPVSATTAEPAAASVRARFVTCLETHGVPASVAGRVMNAGGRRPSRPAPGSAGSPPTSDPHRGPYASAFEACIEAFGVKLGGAGFRVSQAVRAWLSCLEQHGVAVGPAAPAPGQPVPQPGDPSPAGSQALRSVGAACAFLRPSRPGSR